METILDEAKYAVAPFSVVLAVVFPNQSRGPVELLREVRRQTALRNIAIVLGGVLFRPVIVYTKIKVAMCRCSLIAVRPNVTFDSIRSLRKGAGGGMPGRGQ